MVNVTIYIRNMSKEQWVKRLGWLTINDEPADMGVADHHKALISKGDLRYKEIRWVRCTEDMSKAMTALEQIANGFEDESQALLYVNHNPLLVRDIALNIVKYGKDSVWWKYEPSGDKDSDMAA